MSTNNNKLSPQQLEQLRKTCKHEETVEDLYEGRDGSFTMYCATCRMVLFYCSINAYDDDVKPSKVADWDWYAQYYRNKYGKEIHKKDYIVEPLGTWD